MPRAYQEMPPLWWIEEEVKLSDQYPSGLEWLKTNRFHAAGEMAGQPRKDGRYYYVSLLGCRYPAHRVVYYLRTGQDPLNADVMHGADNPERDNRKELTLLKRKAAVAPKWRRRVRNAEGKLVYSADLVNGFSTRDIEREIGIQIID